MRFKWKELLALCANRVKHERWLNEGADCRFNEEEEVEEKVAARRDNGTVEAYQEMQSNWEAGIGSSRPHW